MKQRPQPWSRVRTGNEHDFGVLRVHQDVFRDPRDGSEHPRAIIDAGEWANVVALTPDDRVVMVRQFRFGSQADGLEIPGGVVDADETPEQAAARELEEETGFRAASIEPLGWLWPNPAHFTNKQHTFLATGCEQVHDGTPDGSEDLVVELVPRSDIPRLIETGEIRHALHVAALSLALVRWQGRERTAT